ncbi:MAG: aconitate hydratase [Acidimicrobiales bacterium]
MNSFSSAGAIEVGSSTYAIHRLTAVGNVDRLPYSLKVLLENLLRHEDGASVSESHIATLAGWDGKVPDLDVAFRPARVLMQDFTGVPGVVDLAGMRDAVAALGGDPGVVNPQVPVELVIDHSVIAEVARASDAFARNAEFEMARNQERYALLRWAQQTFEGFVVVPPDIGICHQVNLEYLARVVFSSKTGQAYPDTLVGTDSHTPMVNGLGVLGWGVGGIEAEAAMLGQPVSMGVPPVVGVRLTGALPEGSTATDLVLTIAQRLRAHGVVGKFVEFFGPGVSEVALENRATIGNMSPEYGSTVTIFPIDAETLRYLKFTGRSPEQVALVESYAKEQGLFHEPGIEPLFTETIEFDLSEVEPCIAGPSRPQDRVALGDGPKAFRRALADLERASESRAQGADEASAESFPASDPPASNAGRSFAGSPETPSGEVNVSQQDPSAAAGPEYPSRAVSLRLGGEEMSIDHGAVVIAAITSCTNTSNPQVMMAAGLLARKAVERGLRTKPWVKTSLAPGSQVVTKYLDRAGLTEPLQELGFFLVGYGCTTCIGNSGPLLAGVGEAVSEGDLAVSAVLSGNRNFEGRIHPQVRMNWLASPPLVVAYALAGTMATDLSSEALGIDPEGRPVYLRDIWPSPVEVTDALRDALGSEMFSDTYAEVFTSPAWEAMETPSDQLYAWNEASTYIHRPPFYDGMSPLPEPVTDISGARALVVLGDSITTDHISPAGSIAPQGPAGQWLIQAGVDPDDFNSYGARRGNDQVMVRGTFANTRLRNQLAPGTEGGVTTYLPDGSVTSIFEASRAYMEAKVPLLVLAGKEYGSGSSRDWAAKGTLLLGVRAVLAESYERIHRSNLVGMGILPLEYRQGQSAAELGLTGQETFSISGLDVLNHGRIPDSVAIDADGITFDVHVRIDSAPELAYFCHGGILPFVARQLAGIHG